MIPSLFDLLTPEHAFNLLADLQDTSARAIAWQRAKDYFDGNHWRQGREWRGPRPAGKDAAKGWLEIQSGFVSVNMVKSGLRRHRNALLGSEPNWTIYHAREIADPDAELTDAEKELCDRANAVLLQWWNHNDGLNIFQRACDPLLYAGQSPLRSMVPAGLTAQMDAQGRPLFVEPRGTLEEVIKSIFIDAPKLHECSVVLDKNTMCKVGVYVYKDVLGNELVELSYLGLDNSTILRVMPKAGRESDALFKSVFDYMRDFVFKRGGQAEGVQQGSRTEFQLGGNLLHYLMERDALVTEQVLQNQGLLNMAMTMLPRNVVLGGFLQRIFFNVRRPTESVTDPVTQTAVEVPVDLEVGPGVDTYANGQLYGDAKNPNLANPSAMFKDPIPVQTFEDTARIAATNILDEMFQRHILISGDAVVSGASRIQAKADWLVSLGETAPVINRAGSWVLNTVLKMAAKFAGEEEAFKNVHCEFACTVDPGPLLPEERAQIVTEIEKRVRSTASGMVALGTEDPDAEIAQIDDERFKVGKPEELGAYVSSIRSLISHEEAMRILRYDEEAVKRIRGEMGLKEGEQPQGAVPAEEKEPVAV